MREQHDDERLVLHALRVKGFAQEPEVARLSGLEGNGVASVLERLARDGLCVHREGRITGWSLTSSGRDELEARMSTVRRDAPWLPLVRTTHRSFLAVNQELKQLCTDWQLRTLEGAPVSDDDGNAFELDIRRRLGAIHAEALALLAGVSAELARFDRHTQGLDAAFRRFERGEREALTTPMSGSYHDVWMELHTDLLVTLGVERSDADGA